MHLDDQSLPAYLLGLGVFSGELRLRVEKAGEGNINYVRRARADDGASVVVKQARPSLERFPEYRVTTERIVFEQRYGEVVRELAPAVAHLLPEVVHFDEENRTLVMEDLGDGPRLEDEVLAGRVQPESLEELGRFLGEVHRATSPHATALGGRFANDEMRELHGEHVFTLPYRPNDFPIPDALRAEAKRELARGDALERIDALRERYYGARDALVHGDPQAGNILLQDGRPRLLDAEIAHVGDPAFDLGTLLAHLRFHIALDPNEKRLREAESSLFDGYQLAGGHPDVLARVYRYAGVEMLRRVIGAARPVFLHDPDAARTVLHHGLSLLRS